MIEILKNAFSLLLQKVKIRKALKETIEAACLIGKIHTIRGGGLTEKNVYGLFLNARLNNSYGISK